MDKLATRAAPSIRSFQVQAPIVFAPNVQLTHLKSWRDPYGFYRPMMKALKSQPNTGPVVFLPNVVSPAATIEERSKQLSENLARKRDELGSDRMHLITHSFAGIDARAAISLHGADSAVQSLSTIATPHTGMRLIQQLRDRPSKDDMRFMEKAFAVVGLGVKNVNEFS